MTRSQLLTIISDTYKDLNGFRPKRSFAELSDEQLCEYHNRLCSDLEDAFFQEHQEREELINKVVSLGAGDRETAIRWIGEDY